MFPGAESHPCSLGWCGEPAFVLLASQVLLQVIEFLSLHIAHLQNLTECKCASTADLTLKVAQQASSMKLTELGCTMHKAASLLRVHPLAQQRALDPPRNLQCIKQ